MDSRNIYKKSLKYNTAALYYNLSTSCFFCVFFILIYHNPFICNVLILVFVLEFFVYLFINRVNQCPSVSNKKQCESVSNFFGCGQRPRRVNQRLIFCGYFSKAIKSSYVSRFRITENLSSSTRTSAARGRAL